VSGLSPVKYQFESDREYMKYIRINIVETHESIRENIAMQHLPSVGDFFDDGRRRGMRRVLRRGFSLEGNTEVWVILVSDYLREGE
jgi:hypothetical protein